MDVSASARSVAGVPLAVPGHGVFQTVPKAGAAAPKAAPTTSATAGGTAVGGGNWASVETYYLGLMNCTRTGGWVTSTGHCSSPGGRNVAPLKLSTGISSKVSRPYAKKLAIGAEPDLLFAVASLAAEMGAIVEAAVTTTPSPVLERVPCAEVVIGDLEDLEARAAGCDVLLTHSHGRQAARRLEIPLYRIGLPMFDRLGAAHRVTVGYRGTRDLVFDLANVFLAAEHGHGPDDWPLSPEALAAARGLDLTSLPA